MRENNFKTQGKYININCHKTISKGTQKYNLPLEYINFVW